MIAAPRFLRSAYVIAASLAGSVGNLEIVYVPVMIRISVESRQYLALTPVPGDGSFFASKTADFNLKRAELNASLLIIRGPASFTMILVDSGPAASGACGVAIGRSFIPGQKPVCRCRFALAALGEGNLQLALEEGDLLTRSKAIRSGPRNLRVRCSQPVEEKATARQHKGAGCRAV